MQISAERGQEIKERIARVLSEILSDKYDAKITLRFVPKEGEGNAKTESVPQLHG